MGNVVERVVERVTERCSLAAQPDETNCAFLFIKPHALTPATLRLVRETFARKNLIVEAEGVIDARAMDKRKLVDKHYYVIASKATLLKPAELRVPAAAAAKFRRKFGESFDQVLASGRVLNAAETSSRYGWSAEEMGAQWDRAVKAGSIEKLGGGFYVAKLAVDEPRGGVYVMNGFFLRMRNKYCAPGAALHYFVVKWDDNALPWKRFRAELVGATDPAKAAASSLRGMIRKRWNELGLSEEPSIGENAIHASASPFEALAERLNWLNIPLEADGYGQFLLKCGLTKETIRAWSTDPVVRWAESPSGSSIFDAFEDLDSMPLAVRAVQIANHLIE